MQQVAIGGDDTGLEMKQELAGYVRELGHEALEVQANHLSTTAGQIARNCRQMPHTPSLLPKLILGHDRYECTTDEVAMDG